MKAFGIEVRRVPEVAQKSAEEVWVTADGVRIPIGEMKESHAKHSLAMIMRNLRAGRIAKLDLNLDRIKFVQRRSPSGSDADTLFEAIERDPFGQDFLEELH